MEPSTQDNTAAANPGVAPISTGRANSGGSTNIEETSEIIRPGDVLLITFADLPKDYTLPAFDQRVKDDGSITLLYNQPFQAAGKRTGEMEREIRAFYVPRYFINMTPTVRISTENRFYYVGGEVRAPGKFPYISGITVSKAIAAAGGFTDFANKRSVKLTRPSGRKQTVNCNQVIDHPERDPLVFPDDSIHVNRRIFW